MILPTQPRVVPSTCRAWTLHGDATSSTKLPAEQFCPMSHRLLLEGSLSALDELEGQMRRLEVLLSRHEEAALRVFCQAAWGG